MRGRLGSTEEKEMTRGKQLSRGRQVKRISKPVSCRRRQRNKKGASEGQNMGGGGKGARGTRFL